MYNKINCIIASPHTVLLTGHWWLAKGLLDTPGPLPPYHPLLPPSPSSPSSPPSPSSPSPSFGNAQWGKVRHTRSSSSFSSPFPPSSSSPSFENGQWRRVHSKTIFFLLFIISFRHLKMQSGEKLETLLLIIPVRYTRSLETNTMTIQGLGEETGNLNAIL